MGGLLSICRHINSTLIVIFTVFLLRATTVYLCNKTAQPDLYYSDYEISPSLKLTGRIDELRLLKATVSLFSLLQLLKFPSLVQ